jgi:hypothetical protein
MWHPQMEKRFQTENPVLIFVFWSDDTLPPSQTIYKLFQNFNLLLTRVT